MRGQIFVGALAFQTDFHSLGGLVSCCLESSLRVEPGFSRAESARQSSSWRMFIKIQQVSTCCLKLFLITCTCA